VKQLGCSGVINIKESQSLTFSNESFYSIEIIATNDSDINYHTPSHQRYGPQNKIKIENEYNFCSLQIKYSIKRSPNLLGKFLSKKSEQTY